MNKVIRLKKIKNKRKVLYMKLGEYLYLEYYLIEPFCFRIGFFYDFIHYIDEFIRFVNLYEVEGNFISLDFIQWN